MGRGDASGVDKRKNPEVGQSSGTANVPAKAARQTPEAPSLRFWPGQLNEKHTWLEFVGVKQPHKNNYLNKLFSLHKQVVCPPRYLHPTCAQFFGIQGDINRWFRVEAQVGDRVVSSDLWHNIFTNMEPVYRELCLEFYSTLKLSKELHKVRDIFEERCVLFYCGGTQRKLSIAEFGYYTGMYSREQLNNQDFRALLRKGLYVKQDLGDGESIAQYWTRISGGEAWPTGGSVSVSKIRSVKLRMLHRMIVTFLVQRSTHWDKAYQVDLWLIKLFSEGAPRKFALAPMVVLDRMCNHSDSELVLGHFITQIYRRMGIFDTDECQTDLSPQVFQESFTEKELIRGKIVKKGSGGQNSRLLDDTGVIAALPPIVEAADDVQMEDAPQEPPRPHARTIPVPSSFDLTLKGQTVQNIYEDQQQSRRAFDEYQRRMDQDMTWIGSQYAHTNYTLDYYQPMWQAQFEGKEFVRPDPIPDFSPPPIHVPPYRQGGGSFFPMSAPGNMSPRTHELGGSLRGPVQFGTYQGGHDVGGSSSVAGFDAGTSSGWMPWPSAAGQSGGDASGSGGYAAGDTGGSGSAQEEDDWLTGIFGKPGFPYGYHGQQQ